MTRRSRYLLNVGICVLVLAHAIYRFMGRPEVASERFATLVPSWVVRISGSRLN